MTHSNGKFIFFDRARSFGLLNGVVHVEVIANVLKPGGKDDTAIEEIEVAQLRCTIPAAKSLVAALQHALGKAEVPVKQKKSMN